MEYTPYKFNANDFWNTIEAARSSLSIKQVEFSQMLHFPPRFYATWLSTRHAMKFTRAFQICCGVGLTLDEVMSGNCVGIYQNFLKRHGLSFSDIKCDSLLYSYSQKALIPVFHGAVSTYPDYNSEKKLSDLILNCLAMSKEHLVQFYFRADFLREPAIAFSGLNESTPKDFDSLYNAEESPEVLEAFWEGGVHHFQLDNNLSNKDTAALLGLSESQYYRYQHKVASSKTASQTKSKVQSETEPLFPRILEICNKMGSRIDDLLFDVYSCEQNMPYALRPEADERFLPDKKANIWLDKMFYPFLNTFKAFSLLQVITNYYCKVDQDKKEALWNLAESLV